MDDLLDILLKTEKQYEDILKSINELLVNAPEGALRITHHGKTAKYYCTCTNEENQSGIQSKKNGKGIYIKKKDLNLAFALAQKDYNRKVLKVAQSRINQIKRITKDYNPYEIENVYSELKECRKELVKPIILPLDKYVEAWEGVVYDKKGFHENDPEIFTERGERVRSKSEKILADKFFLMNIPYRYEYPIKLKGIGLIHPDFTLLNRRTRKEYYWEHLGLMDIFDYAESAIMRIETYEKNGIIPGCGLITSYETKKHPVNMHVVEKLIHAYLL